MSAIPSRSGGWSHATPVPGPTTMIATTRVFDILEGTASILIGDRWVDVGKGSFIRIPAGVTHDFENRTDARMGLLNFFIPGGFEKNMPAIVEWFEHNR